MSDFLSTSQFYKLSGYTESVISNMGMADYLVYIIGQFSDIIEQEINTLFTLQNDYSDTYRGGNMYYLSIGAWQETNLTVSRGQYLANNTPTLLVANVDYILAFYKNARFVGKSNPVIGIELLNSKILDTEYLKVEGTYGWSNGLPSDLETAVYKAVKTAVEYNYNTTKSKGAGVKGSESDLTVSRNFNNPNELIMQADKLAFGDLLSVPSIAKMIKTYKGYAMPKRFIIS